MHKFKIAIVAGARPNFIKLSPLYQAFASCQNHNQNPFEVWIVHTGQHYDEAMDKIFFEEMDIPMPEFNLHVGSGAQGQQTGRMLEGIEAAFLKKKPDCVVVIGDTNSTLAGALAAVKMHIPVAHVEAGLRSFNRKMPEEINRIICDHACDMLFAPTERAYQQLLKENIPDEKVINSGDVMLDATNYFTAKAEKGSQILERYKLHPKFYILATIHRAENTNDSIRLYNILDVLSEISNLFQVVVPLHPRTKQILEQDNKLSSYESKLLFIPPVGYLDMLMLEKNAVLITTDSGGVQKEAFFQQVPCVTLRDETEWVELVESGWNSLVSPDSKEKMLQKIKDCLKIKPAKKIQPYGKGDAAIQIAETILSKLSK